MLRYLEFLLENKDEFNLYYSKKFRSILSEISNGGNEIAEILLQVENDDMYRSKFTLIDVTDKNDTISFIQSNRITRKNPDLNDRDNGVLPPKIAVDSNKSELWNTGRTYMIIGRWVRKLFTDVLSPKRKSMVINNTELEKFINQYKSTYDSHNNVKLEIVQGEDIRYWYSDRNYQNNKGQLGNSCMRESYKARFFDIYVKNPDVCKLLILRSEIDNSKIKGRALLWKLKNGKYYQDRIYTNADSDISLFENWAIKEGIDYYNNYTDDMTVKLGDYVYDKYPYMDTFIVYNAYTKELKNSEDLWPGQGFDLLQNTNGGFRSGDAVWSEYEQEYINREDAVMTVNDEWVLRSVGIYVANRDEWYSPEDDNIIWSEWAGENFHAEDAVYSELMNDWLPISNDRVIEVITGDDVDYVVKDMYYLYIERDGKFYSRSHWVEDPFTGEWVNRMKIIETENGKKRFYEILNSRLISEIYSNSEAIDTLIRIYKSGEYDREKVKEAIENNHYYKNMIIGVYWGLSKEDIPTVDDIIIVLFGGIHCNGFFSMKSEIDRYSTGFSAKWNKWQEYDNRLINLLFKVVETFDYKTLGDDVYKIWAYFNI
jgi:hypothetical protein